MITKTARTLYHGSSKALDTIQPFETRAYTHLGPVVFATPDKDVSLAFAGNHWGDATLNNGSVNGKKYFTEMKPGAFESAFPKGKPGFVHHLDGATFKKFRTSYNEEVSNSGVTPLRVQKIKDVHTKIKARYTVNLFDKASRPYQDAVSRMAKRVVENPAYMDYIKSENSGLAADIQTFLKKKNDHQTR